MADAGTAMPAGEGPMLQVEGFAGPLDLLLELLRRQRLDLGSLSFAALTEQFLAAMQAGTPRIPLERRSAWLVMASDLVLLKARLLCPETPAAAEAATIETARRLEQLTELARMRAAADWLGARPQLGLRVFARGQTERQARPQAAQYVAFLEATLAMLEDRDGLQGGEGTGLPACEPASLGLWRLPDALGHIARLLRQCPEGLSLAQCLPAIAPAAPQRPRRLRAALASTLLASLEMARSQCLQLAQDEAFGTITLRSVLAPGGQ